MINIICYGTGTGLDRIYELIKKDNVAITGLIDTFATDSSPLRYGLKPLPPQSILNLNYNFVVVCSMHYESITEKLFEYGVAPDKILYPLRDLDNQEAYLHLVQGLRNHNEVYNSVFLENNRYNISDQYHIIKDNLFANKQHKLKQFSELAIEDYARFATLQLIVMQICKRNVPGDIAELGVYKGSFAKCMQELLPERTIHLFDTFEGFIDSDVEFDYSRDHIEQECYNIYSDTNVELVLNNMVHKHKCIIHKGYFPDTTKEMKDDTHYALVSLDADLYKPIHHGLHYFYERLNKGGYIMVHDYSAPWYNGTTEAVDKFCEQHDISPVPICDNAGTVILTK